MILCNKFHVTPFWGKDFKIPERVYTKCGCMYVLLMHARNKTNEFD